MDSSFESPRNRSRKIFVAAETSSNHIAVIYTLFSKEKLFCRTSMSYEYYEHDEEEEELEEDIFDDTSMFRVGWLI